MAKEEIFFGINIDTGDVIKDFGTLKKRTKELKKELDGTKVGTKRFEELKKEITANQATIRRFNRELRDTKSLATRVGQGVTNAFKTAGVALAGAFAVTEIIRYGKEIAELTKELTGLTNQIQQLTKVSNDNAKALANQAKAINQVYGADTQDLIKSAVALAGQFGITTEEALDKIELGFAAGLNNSGEFLEILKEYPALLSEVGLNADETFSIINAQVTQGVYSDKGIDAIKEAGLRLRELPKATKDALNAIGISADTIQRDLTSGTRTVFQVIQQVSNKLGELPPQSSEVGKAIADIFGGPGEDAGLKFLTTLGKIDTNFENITESLSDYSKSQMALVDAQENLNSVFNQFFGDGSTGFNNLKAEVIDFTANALRDLIINGAKLINVFIDLFNESAAFRAVIKGIAIVTEASFDIVKVQVKTVIRSFKDLFLAFGQALEGNFSQAFNTLSKSGQDIISDFRTTGKEVAESFKQGFNDVINPKEKIKLIDLSSPKIKEPVKAAAKNTGKNVANSYLDGQKEAIDIATTSGDSAIVQLAKAQTQALKEQGDKQLDDLEAINDSKVKSEKMTAEQLNAINQTRLDSIGNLVGSTINLLSLDENSRKKNAKLIKTLSIAEVGVNLAKQLSNIAAVNSSPSNLANLFTFGGAGLSVSAIQTAAAIANAATSIASIQSQKFAKGGILNGPSHAQGGIKTPFGELEGGEAVINKKSTKKYGGILSAINEAGGGKKFARGGILPNPSTISTPNSLNSDILKAINSIDMKPTVSVVEINEAQTRISEIENNSTL
jgi:hypothetical protein